VKTNESPWCSWVEKWANGVCNRLGVKCFLNTCWNKDACILDGNRVRCHCQELEASDHCNVTTVGKWMCKCKADDHREVYVFELCSSSNGMTNTAAISKNVLAVDIDAILIKSIKIDLKKNN
jgi:hypothetical protein